MSELRESVTKRIRALLEKTVENGATEAEAMSAATKARELMDRYRLSMTDMEVKSEPITKEVVGRANDLRYAPADYCLWGMEAYCGVKTWFHKSKGQRRLVIFGLESDVSMAKHLYAMIEAAIKSEMARFQRSQGYRDRYETRGFQMGMSSRINERLKQLAKSLEPVAKTATGTALVVVKNAVVEESFRALRLNMRTSRVSFNGGHAGAHKAGRAAGDRVNFNRPLSGGARALIG